jgi:hypothetical protein
MGYAKGGRGGSLSPAFSITMASCSVGMPILYSCVLVRSVVDIVGKLEGRGFQWVC